MPNNHNETKSQRKMRLVIHIILYFLLALAFVAMVQVEVMKYDGRSPFVSANLLFLFIIGFILIIFAFAIYVFKKNLSLWEWVIGLTGASFSLIFFKTLLDELKHSGSHWFVKLINYYTKESSLPLSLYLVLIITMIILILIVMEKNKSLQN